MDVAYPLEFVEACEAVGLYAQTERNARAIVDLAGLSAGERVLDAPCGIGRYAAALHRLGFDVTAIDLSKEQLEFAQRQNPGPKYRRADMRHPPGEPYDLILNLFSSFGYFESQSEDAKLLNSWHQCLRPSGRLIIEVADADRVRKSFDGKTTRELRNGQRYSEVATMDWDRGLLSTTFLRDGKQVFDCWLRVYTSDQLRVMLENAGFRRVQLFGSFEGSAKQPGDRAIFVAQKSAPSAGD